jgi:hypothetical protein
MDDKGEPPSTSRAKSLFRIGRNSRGNWVVQDQSGLCGGMFVNRTEAVKFAMFENGNRPQALIMVPGILELDMNARPRVAGGIRKTNRPYLPWPMKSTHSGSSAAIGAELLSPYSGNYKPQAPSLQTLHQFAAHLLSFGDRSPASKHCPNENTLA